MEVKLAKMGTHKIYERERMVARWKTESGVLTLEIDKRADPVLLLMVVCCIERW